MAFHHESVGRKKARDLLARTGHHLGKAGGYMRDHTSEHTDRQQDIDDITSAISQHDKQLHGGKRTKLTFRRGGYAEDGLVIKPHFRDQIVWLQTHPP